MKNWKTTLSGVGSGLMFLLAIIADAPAELGEVSTLFPPEWKARIMISSAIAAFLLKSVNSHFQADKPSATPTP